MNKNYSAYQKQKLLNEVQKIPKKNMKHFLQWYGVLISLAQRLDFVEKYPLPTVSRPSHSVSGKESPRRSSVKVA